MHVFFFDYVRMVKAHKGIAWNTIVDPADLRYLDQPIDPAGWYPMASFERGRQRDPPSRRQVPLTWDGDPQARLDLSWASPEDR